jgi:putative lipase involved disintegration of autophagic bodies
MVVQGSVSRADVENDFDFLPTYGTLTRGAVVHRGFVNTLLEWANDRSIGAKSDWDIDDDVDTFVTAVIAEIDSHNTDSFASVNRLFITGFSLGGAVAQLLGYMFDKNYSHKVSVTTYGCPNIFYHLQVKIEPRVPHEWRNYIVRVNAEGVNFTDPVAIVKAICYKLGRQIFVSPKTLRERMIKLVKEDRGTSVVVGGYYVWLAQKHYHHRVLLHKLSNYVEDKSNERDLYND